MCPTVALVDVSENFIFEGNRGGAKAYVNGIEWLFRIRCFTRYDRVSRNASCGFALHSEDIQEGGRILIVWMTAFGRGRNGDFGVPRG